jgi:predicted nuclease of restriction endonuclease-like (RecB) superfamily
VTERQLEMALLERLKSFLLELGKGFAFVGNQVHLEVGGKDFYLDLLFYHLHLRCYVVIDLKVEEFKPEFAGKMNYQAELPTPKELRDQLRKAAKSTSMNKGPA